MSQLIYVVDDDDRSRKLAVDVLSHGGHEVVGLPTGEAALERLGQQRPDLVLLDIQLPGINGLEVLAWIRQQPALAGLPVLAVTASVMPAQHGDLARAGFAMIIAKPLAIKQLIATVNQFLPACAPVPPADPAP